MEKVEHGWEELEHARITGNYSSLEKKINAAWGPGTYEILKVCPTDPQSAWFMSARLDASTTERKALDEIIRQRILI